MNTYLLFKALHIIGFVLWIGGLFSLSGLLRFQKQQQKESKGLFSSYGKRLYFSMNLPGLTLTIVFGLLMVVENPGLAKGGWFHAKMLFVLVLLIFDHFILRTVKKITLFEISNKVIKIFASVIGALFLVLIYLATLKPF